MRFLYLLICTFALTLTAVAQPGVVVAGNPTDKDTPGASARLLDEVRKQVAVGRGQLDANQIASIETLRNASQKSLAALVSFVGPQVLTAMPEDIPSTGFWAAAARQTADAHYWWGRAADQYGRRDEAITAFARAIRFAGQLRGGSNTVARDALLSLGGSLRDGLPQNAPDDTLETIATIAHGNLWAPRRFVTDFSNLSFTVHTDEAEALANEKFKHEFLITSGQLYPPVPSATVDPSKVLSRVPPLYRNVNEAALPDVLKLDRMIIGYERDASKDNRGIWRQVVRVFYASPYLTRDGRDDRKRAEAICAQFLKVHSLMNATLGLENPFVKDGVTTLWLSEVSSWWPRDDDDPRIRESLGPSMPKINVHTADGRPAPVEIDTPPTSYPWRAAGQMDSAPGEIMFFKMTAPRDEPEWLREIMHEYGHVVLPAFDNFKPPLEPYANGMLGETLGMLWVAGDPSDWGVSVETSTSAADNATLPAVVRDHVKNEALAGLKFWRSKGVVSALRRDTGAPGLRYLQGLTVYIERVYGARVLSAAFAPIADKGANASDALERTKVLNTESLLTSFPDALRDSLGTAIRGTEVRIVVGDTRKKTLPIWLGGALESPNQTENDLISRAPLKLKAGEHASGWLFVPPSAENLRVEWRGNGADQLQAETMKAVATPPLHPDAKGAILLDLKGRTGWQKFSFLSRGEITILSSQFEK